MIYGLYLSAQGADVQSKRLDVVAHNLANASTTGFKRELAVFQAHRPFDDEQGRRSVSAAARSPEPPGLDEVTGGLSLAQVATDFADGPAVETGGMLDVALGGPGFLRVSDGRQEYLTRNGSLTLNARRELVTHQRGWKVLAAGGNAVVIPPDAASVEIGADGTIWRIAADGTRAELDRLDVVRVPLPERLEKLGDSFYRNDQPLQPARDAVQVRQGFLESSSVNSVMEMLQMIEATRAFETNVNMIRLQDEALGQLLQLPLQ